MMLTYKRRNKMAETYKRLEIVKNCDALEKTFQDILDACGDRTVKEKISLLHLTIDHLYRNNKEYVHLSEDQVSVH